MNRAISVALTEPPLTLPANTTEAFNETNIKDKSEHIVVIPKYGPRESLGPSHKQ